MALGWCVCFIWGFHCHAVLQSIRMAGSLWLLFVNMLLQVIPTKIPSICLENKPNSQQLWGLGPGLTFTWAWRTKLQPIVTSKLLGNQTLAHLNIQSEPHCPSCYSHVVILAWLWSTHRNKLWMELISRKTLWAFATSRFFFPLAIPTLLIGMSNKLKCSLLKHCFWLLSFFLLTSPR